MPSPTRRVPSLMRLDQSTVKAVRTRLVRWGRANQRRYPWRDQQATPYEVAVAELLLRRTTATAAARLFPAFISEFPDWAALGKASEKRIAKRLQPVGLSRQRARDLRRLAHLVIWDYGGTLPTSLPALLKLPGLGPYSARAVLSFAQGRRAAVVDSNVSRVLGRLFWPSLKQAPPAKLQATADSLVAPRNHRSFNFALLDLSASVCRYDRPRCEKCPLQVNCRYFQLTSRKVAADGRPGRRVT
jgi:A/G-specific adenine glycosylase